MKARSQVKRRDDRQAAKLTLLNRARRITHILSGIPTGKDAWTVDDHRAAIVAAPAIIPAIHVARLRRETHGVAGPPTLAEHQAELAADRSVARVAADRRAPPGPTITPARRAELQAARAEGR